MRLSDSKFIQASVERARVPEAKKLLASDLANVRGKIASGMGSMGSSNQAEEPVSFLHPTEARQVYGWLTGIDKEGNARVEIGDGNYAIVPPNELRRFDEGQKTQAREIIASAIGAALGRSGKGVRADLHETSEPLDLDETDKLLSLSYSATLGIPSDSDVEDYVASFYSGDSVTDIDATLPGRLAILLRKSEDVKAEMEGAAGGEVLETLDPDEVVDDNKKEACPDLGVSTDKPMKTKKAQVAVPQEPPQEGVPVAPSGPQNNPQDFIKLPKSYGDYQITWDAPKSLTALLQNIRSKGGAPRSELEAVVNDLRSRLKQSEEIDKEIETWLTAFRYTLNPHVNASLSKVALWPFNYNPANIAGGSPNAPPPDVSPKDAAKALIDARAEDLIQKAIKAYVLAGGDKTLSKTTGNFNTSILLEAAIPAIQRVDKSLYQQLMQVANGKINKQPLPNVPPPGQNPPMQPLQDNTPPQQSFDFSSPAAQPGATTQNPTQGITGSKKAVKERESSDNELVSMSTLPTKGPLTYLSSITKHGLPPSSYEAHRTMKMGSIARRGDYITANVSWDPKLYSKDNSDSARQAVMTFVRQRMHSSESLTSFGAVGGVHIVDFNEKTGKAKVRFASSHASWAPTVTTED